MLSETELIQTDILAFLDQNEKKELLRFVTVGSVDDGKSTLIGRLLHDTKGVYDDQLKDAIRTSETGEQEIDFARITDGLRAEREQGITIDVAYRYFSTPKRKFIIADTPGHIQYTRNMATGASTAHVGLILIDARLGVLQQSRRHAFIADQVGIPHLLVCVNKMDLVDYDTGRYNAIVADFEAFAKELGFRSVSYIPVSALMGVNIVETSHERTPWYDGPSVLGFLETVDISHDVESEPFRFPVQYVIRPNLDYRGYAGQITSGSVSVGDAIRVYPSKKTTHVVAIDTYDGALQKAIAPLSVVIRLADEIDISRGDMLVCCGDNEPHLNRHIEAMVVWMSDEPLDPRKSYLIKQTTRYVRTQVDALCWKLDMETLERVKAPKQLELNDIGLVRLTTHQPLIFDAYRDNRGTGAFVIVDSLTNNTVGAGMIADSLHTEEGEEDWTRGHISAESRAKRAGHASGVICLKGTSTESQRKFGKLLEEACFNAGLNAIFLPKPSDETRNALLSIGCILIQAISCQTSRQVVIGLGERISGVDLNITEFAHTQQVIARIQAEGWTA